MIERIFHFNTSDSLISHLSSSSLQNNPLSPVQQSVDTAVSQLSHGITEGHILAAMTVGSLVSRMTQVGVLRLGSRTQFSSLLLRPTASTLGLVNEAVAFEGTSRLFQSVARSAQPNLWSLQGEGGWFQSLPISLLHFATLKIGGTLGQHSNLVIQHALTSGAMVLGHHLTGILELTSSPHNSFGEEMIRAEIMNLQFLFGAHLTHALIPQLPVFISHLDPMRSLQKPLPISSNGSLAHSGLAFSGNFPLSQLNNLSRKIPITEEFNKPLLMSNESDRWRGTILGTEYDPSRISTQTVEQEKARIESLLENPETTQALQQRKEMTRDAVIQSTPTLQPLFSQGLSLASVRQLYAQTEFLRRPASWVFLDEWLSQSTQNPTIIANLAPGFVNLPNNLRATYEPFLLSSYSPNSRVIVYDHSPESLEVVQNFRGTLPIYAHWEFRRVLGSRAPQVLHQLYGKGWEEALSMQEELFYSFVERTQAEVKRAYIANHQGTPYPIVELTFPKNSFSKIETAPKPVDLVTGDLGNAQWDLTHFFVGGRYFNANRSDELFSTVALIKIVNAMKAGGILLTDPHQTLDNKGNTIMLPHSPSPAMMSALGLEPIAFVGTEISPRWSARIFQKMNDPTFLNEQAERINNLLNPSLL